MNGGFGFLISLASRFMIGDIQQLAQTLSVQDTWRMPPWLEGSSLHKAMVAQLPGTLSIYLSINQIHFERLWLSLLPSGQRKPWRIKEGIM